MMRDVILYGHLRAEFGHKFRLAVSSPAEAIAALGANLRGFTAYLRKNSLPGYKILIGDKLLQGEQELCMISKDAPIRIVPVVGGASGGMQVIAGIILVVAGAVLTSFGYGAIGQPMMNAGYAMIVGGVVRMLVGTPNVGDKERPENSPSYTFNGAVNTLAQGNPVPIAYGEVRVGSQVISAGITTDDMILINGSGNSDYGGNDSDGWGRARHDMYDRMNEQ